MMVNNKIRFPYRLLMEPAKVNFTTDELLTYCGAWVRTEIRSGPLEGVLTDAKVTTTKEGWVIRLTVMPEGGLPAPTTMKIKEFDLLFYRRGEWSV